jgi:hypothetical protein
MLQQTILPPPPTKRRAFWTIGQPAAIDAGADIAKWSADGESRPRAGATSLPIALAPLPTGWILVMQRWELWSINGMS